jgi:adenylate cyclase
MDGRKVKRKLAAIVSTDVKGYSRLMSDDDVETVKSIKACRRIMAQKIEGHRGRVVDSPGDNLLSEFSSVADAVQCAVEIQVALHDRNQSLPRGREMEFRIGINLGDVIEDGDQIYGEGLNIAARIESIAPGGGICISGSAFDQVKKLLPLGYEFLGEKALKNISDKIPVCRVLTDPKDSGKLIYLCKYDNPKFRRNKRLLIGFVLLCLVGTGLFYRMKYSVSLHPVPLKIREKLMQMHLPDKPSIAVLPFMNMSEDPEQEYFSDGLTEDLITDLSKVSGLFVIARNSVFAYKDKSVNINEVGRELGVKYVLEGSVRKVGNRVRITAQLIDAKSEGHIWVERYDRGLEDIFSVQDEVRNKIVMALSVELTSDDEKRMKKKSTSDLMAYDYYLRGLELHATKMEGGLEKSKVMFQKAIDIDPGYARAYAALGHAVLMEWIFGFNRDKACLDEALELAQKAVVTDPDESAGYGLRGHVYLWTKHHDKGIGQIRKAIALGPNNAEWIAALGEQLTWSGKFLDGIHYLEQAMRLDPQYPAFYLWNLGHAHYLAGQYDKSADIFLRALIMAPDFWPSHAYLALAYDALGLKDKAAIEIREARSATKNQSLLAWEDRLPYKDPKRAVLIVDRLKEMGFH